MILITGAGGYLGTVLVEQYLRETTETLALLDRFDYGLDPLRSVLRQYRDRVYLHVGSVTHLGMLRAALRGVDQIIHLAGCVGTPACEAFPDRAVRDNLAATGLLLAAAGGRPVLFTSTTDVYGTGGTEALTETAAVQGATRYTQHKLLCEAQVLGHPGGGTVARLSTLFGVSPRMRWDSFIHDTIRQLVEQGLRHGPPYRLYEPQVRRSFLPVEQAAWVLRRLAQEAHGGIWNVGRQDQHWGKGTLVALLQEHIRKQLDLATAVVEGVGGDPNQRDAIISYDKVTPYLPPPVFVSPVLYSIIEQAAQEIQREIGLRREVDR